MTHINAKAMPINDNGYKTCLTNRMGSVSCHITPWDGHTHMQTHTHILMIRTGSILRNQACASCSRRTPGLTNFHCEVGYTHYFQLTPFDIVQSLHPVRGRHYYSVCNNMCLYMHDIVICTQ